MGYGDGSANYTYVPGISLGPFTILYLLVTLTGDGEFHVHGHCYEGVLNKSPLKIASGHSASELAIPLAALSYSSNGLFKEITSTKYARSMQTDDRL